MRSKRALALGAAFLGVAAPAGAIPLAISNTDLTWRSPESDGPSSTLTVHLEDLADPRPDVGQIRMTLSGHVEQDFDSDPWSYVWHIAFLIYPQYDDSILRVASIDPRESYPFLTDAFNTWEDVLGEVDPDFAAVSYYVEDAGIGRDSDPSFDWHSTVILTVIDLEVGDTKDLTFKNSFQIAECTTRQNCQTGPELISEGTTIHIATIPEPGTALLVSLGLLALAAHVRARPC